MTSMVSIVLQLILSLLLLVCAWRVRRSIPAPKSLSWSQIMGQIARGNNHLASLSYGCIFSEGIESSSQEMWARIGGINGLIWIYKNVGVLLIALDYIESNYPQSPSFSSAIDELRRDAADIRVTALILLVRQSLRQLLGDSAALLKVASNYSGIIAHLGLAINDYAPELMPRYIPAISQV